MKQAIATGLPTHDRPFEWAILADGILYTAAAPLKADGTAETGDITTQTRLALGNLSKMLAASGGTLADVTQIMLYVTDREFIDPITAVWTEFFAPPFPNRGTVIVSEIGIKGVGLLLMVHAHIGKNA